MENSSVTWFGALLREVSSTRKSLATMLLTTSYIGLIGTSPETRYAWSRSISRQPGERTDDDFE